MKLLFLSNVFPPQVLGGEELICLDIAQACQRAGHEVTVVSSFPVGDLANRDVPHQLRVLRLFAPTYDLFSDGRPYRQFDGVTSGGLGMGGIVTTNCLALEGVIRAEKPDLLWCFSPLGLGPVGIFEVAAMSGTPTVVQLGDSLDALLGASQNGFDLTGRWAEAKSRLAAISVSEATLAGNSTIGEYGMTAVIPSGIPFGTVSDQRRRFRRIEADESLRLVYFGQIIPEKGVTGLVPALRRLRRLLSRPVELHLLGRCPPDYEASLRAAIRNDGLEDSVVWHGMLDREDVDRVLAEMHIAVLPLRVDEPFGRVGMEAAAQRLPVVANARAGFASLLPQGYPYLLDDPMSVDDIVARVHSICSDQDACEQWVDLACKQVREQGELEQVILPRYMSFIEDVRSWAVPSPAHSGDMGSLLASWQMNRNLAQLVPEPLAVAPQMVAAGRPAAWRRYGRKMRIKLRNMVPETYRLQLWKAAGLLRPKSRTPR